MRVQWSSRCSLWQRAHRVITHTNRRLINNFRVREWLLMASQMESHGFFVCTCISSLARLLFGPWRRARRKLGRRPERCFIAVRLQIYRSLDLTFASKKVFPPSAGGEFDKIENSRRRRRRSALRGIAVEITNSDNE